MSVKQSVTEIFELVPKSRRSVVVVMQVDIDVTPTTIAQVGQPVEILRVILVLWEEEGMLRHTTITVVKAFKQARILNAPAINTCDGGLVISSVAAWLVVVADRKEDIERFGRAIVFMLRVC